MPVESVGAVQWRTGSDAEPFLGLWDLEVVARVLERLVGRPTSLLFLERQAVSLGLAHLPLPGQPCVLSAEAVSRLFLAAFRLPAHVDWGTERSLRQSVREGCTVWVPLGDEDATPPSPAEPVTQLHEIVSLGELVVVQATAETAPEALSVREFLIRWSAGGRLLVAASTWDRLARQGRRFFAGTRDPDGALHWNTAGCATNASGEILRF